jgi:hypothetical protein
MHQWQKEEAGEGKRKDQKAAAQLENPNATQCGIQHR